MAALSLILGCAATRKCALSAKNRSSLAIHNVFDFKNVVEWLMLAVGMQFLTVC